MTKQALRNLYLQKRSGLTQDEYIEYNYKLYENFFLNINLPPVITLHTFLPLEKKREPNTWLIINKIKRDYPHIRIVLPRINTNTNSIDNVLYEGTHQLKKIVGKFLSLHKAG